MNESRQSRREFLYNLSAVAASTLLFGSCSDDNKTVSPPVAPVAALPARAGRPNPYVNGSGQPLVVCVEGYNTVNMLQAGLSTLGGLGLILGDREPVLIKPNCNAVDTYPGVSRVETIVALINAARQVTTGAVQVGDEGYHSTVEVYPHMFSEGDIERTGAALVRFEDHVRVRQDHWSDEIEDVRVYSSVYEAPVIINCCNLKRHLRAGMSCALKNNVGTITEWEMRGSRYHLHRLSDDDFMRWVAEIAALIKPDLSIVDARQILTVNGPFSWWGEPVVANKLILGGDMVACDAYAARLMADVDETFSLDQIRPTLERAEELGLGTADLSQVEVVELSI